MEDLHIFFKGIIHGPKAAPCCHNTVIPLISPQGSYKIFGSKAWGLIRGGLKRGWGLIRGITITYYHGLISDKGRHVPS